MDFRTGILLDVFCRRSKLPEWALQTCRDLPSNFPPKNGWIWRAVWLRASSFPNLSAMQSKKASGGWKIWLPDGLRDLRKSNTRQPSNEGPISPGISARCSKIQGWLFAYFRTVGLALRVGSG